MTFTGTQSLYQLNINRHKILNFKPLHINYVNISNLQRGWGADKSCNPGPKVINPDCKVILSYFLCPRD